MKKAFLFLMQGFAVLLALFAVFSSVIVTVDLIGRKSEDDSE